MSSRRLRTVEDLTSEQRAVIEAARAEWRTPESRADEDAIRQSVREEVPLADVDPIRQRPEAPSEGAHVP
jgi:hypothetical protein